VTVAHLFVYGTLRPGDCRWHLLAPFVGDGWVDTTAGQLFDTGFDYPAAVFSGDGTIVGHTFVLTDATVDEVLVVLDEVEGVVEGEYRRVAIRTGSGVAAWAYECGDPQLNVVPIPSGDWLAHRPIR
jgi:gamma-glutamylcyclotransferase (GGCT)/AIG2-like uncharacterized protein YtfP